VSKDPFAKLLNAQQDPVQGAAAVDAALRMSSLPDPILGSRTRAGSSTEIKAGPVIENDPDAFLDEEQTPDEFAASPKGAPGPAFTDAAEHDEAQSSITAASTKLVDNGPVPESGEQKTDTSPELPRVVLPWDGGDEDSPVDEGGLVGESPSFDDEEEDVEPPSRNPLGRLSGWSPGDFFAQHPTWKRPILFGGGGLAAALAVALLFGGSPASETAKTATPTVVESTESAPESAVTTLLPKLVSASCPPGSTSATLAFTTKPENAWVCGRANGVDGSVMNILFDKPVIVKSVTVMPGWNYVAPNGEDRWIKHRLVTKILWRIGGQQFVQNINPTRSGATITLPNNGVATSVMSMTILQTIRPDAVKTEGLGDTPDGSLIPPGAVGTNGDESDTDAATAISSVTITGVDV